MTSGAAIAHAERTPAKNSGLLSGVRLWIALPRRDRGMAALFQQVERVPVDELRGGIVQVFAGSLNTLRSPATHQSGDLRRRCPGASGSRSRCAAGSCVRACRTCLESGLQLRRATAAGASAALPWRQPFRGVFHQSVWYLVETAAFIDVPPAAGGLLPIPGRCDQVQALQYRNDESVAR